MKGAPGAAVDPFPSLVRPRSFTGPDGTLLLTLAGLWGFSFLFIEVALTGVGPIWVVVGRTGVGAAVLFGVLALRGEGVPRGRGLWPRVAFLGLLTNAVPWSAAAWGQQFLPSGLVALLMAAVPTFTLVVSVAARLERFTPGRVVGLGLALSGVALTVAADTGEPERVAAIGAGVGATVLYACGAVYANRRVAGRASPLAVAAGQVLVAFLLTLPAALLLDPVPDPAAVTLPVMGAVLCLGALGTGAAYLVFYTLIERVGATNTTLVTYLIPLVAVAAGALFLGERLGYPAVAGGLLILAGIWVAQRGTRARG